MRTFVKLLRHHQERTMSLKALICAMMLLGVVGSITIPRASARSASTVPAATDEPSIASPGTGEYSSKLIDPVHLHFVQQRAHGPCPPLMSVN
jgi:hypothetical protein